MLAALAVAALVFSHSPFPAGTGPGRTRPVARTATSAPSRPSVRRARSPMAPIVSMVKTQDKVVALTFDDGPDPRYTPAVLALARDRHVPLTFFVVGRQVQSHPELLQQEAAEGHAIGNHTWDHPLLPGHRVLADASEIARCGALLQSLLGKPTTLFRPPSGEWDRATRDAAGGLGYQIILWSAAVGHHSVQTPQAMASRIIRRIRPGAIILAHDGDPTGNRLNRTPNIQAAAIIVAELQRRGYRFVTVPELLALHRAGAPATRQVAQSQ
jgi:peptidoglycan-N-acetylglucosamine deacetylase